MALAPEFTEAFYQALSSLPEMRKPQTNLVDYIAIFKSSVDDPAALAIIQQVDFSIFYIHRISIQRESLSIILYSWRRRDVVWFLF
jgi:hypothetical protein